MQVQSAPEPPSIPVLWKSFQTVTGHPGGESYVLEAAHVLVCFIAEPRGGVWGWKKYKHRRKENLCAQCSVQP